MVSACGSKVVRVGNDTRVYEASCMAGRKLTKMKAFVPSELATTKKRGELKPGHYIEMGYRWSREKSGEKPWPAPRIRGLSHPKPGTGFSHRDRFAGAQQVDGSSIPE